MSNLAKLDIVALDISGNNYLLWAHQAEIRLKSKKLWKIVVEENNGLVQDQDKLEEDQSTAMIFLLHHIHEGLQNEYLTVKDPFILWTNLKERFEHIRLIILPKAKYDWIHLRFQDYKSVRDYNSALFQISSQLMLCGETIIDLQMIEKTLSTFHASSVLLQQQYRAQGFTKYSALISCLLVAEQNNELLMKNHNMRPTGSTPLPEANGTVFPEVNTTPHNKHRHGRGGNHGYGRGRGNNHSRNHGSGRNQGKNNHWHREGYHPYKNNTPYHPKWNKNAKGKGVQRAVKKDEDGCYRCGMQGHWSRKCHIPKHLVDLYQASLKGKEKEIETHFADHNDPLDITHLDVADFLVDPNANIDCLNNNESGLNNYAMY